MADAAESCRKLARACADAGLSIHSARAIFEAVYLSDVLAVSGGNVTKAAEIAGIRREQIHRRWARFFSAEDKD